MKRLLASCALACALFTVVSAGPPIAPGADPQPTPTPCGDCFEPEGGGTNATSDGSFVTILVDGALLIISLLP